MLMSYPECMTVRGRHSSEIYHLGILVGISTPIKISQFPKKKLAAPTSGIPKRLRMSKSVENCGNVYFFIYAKLKNALYKWASPCSTKHLIPSLCILYLTGTTVKGCVHVTVKLWMVLNYNIKEPFFWFISMMHDYTSCRNAFTQFPPPITNIDI